MSAPPTPEDSPAGRSIFRERGKNRYSADVLVGGWFFDRLEPGFVPKVVEVAQRRAAIDVSEPFSSAVPRDTLIRRRIQAYNAHNRSNIGLLRGRLPNPLQLDDPPGQWGHPEPDMYESMYNVTLGLCPEWRRRRVSVDQSGSFICYGPYDPSTHWQTETQSQFSRKPIPSPHWRQTHKVKSGIVHFQKDGLPAEGQQVKIPGPDSRRTTELMACSNRDQEDQQDHEEDRDQRTHQHHLECQDHQDHRDHAMSNPPGFCRVILPADNFTPLAPNSSGPQISSSDRRSDSIEADLANKDPRRTQTAH